MLFRLLKWTGLIFLLSLTILFLTLYFYTHRGSRPWIATSFPAISDWSSLRITLSRGPCLGTCPVYEVSIDGMGNVLFRGDLRSSTSFYGVQRVNRSKISATSVLALFAAFKRAQFFWLYDIYAVGATDLPLDRIGIEYDGHKKEIVDYMGRNAGMPKQVTELEDMIDHLAGTSKLLAFEDAPPTPDSPPAPSLIEPEKPRPSLPKITTEETEETH
jgi:hypothetical protein